MTRQMQDAVLEQRSAETLSRHVDAVKAAQARSVAAVNAALARGVKYIAIASIAREEKLNQVTGDTATVVGAFDRATSRIEALS